MRPIELLGSASIDAIHLRDFQHRQQKYLGPPSNQSVVNLWFNRSVTLQRSALIAVLVALDAG
jgi:hypothetical protein